MALRERLERIRNDGGVPVNEETTKFQIIVPILNDLGWDVYKNKGTGEVRFEHPVGGAKEGGRVDIALMGERGRCECFVEAKKPGVNLDDHVAQLLRYAFHDGVTVCVLTDGLEWRLYLPREAGPPVDRLFARLRLQEDPIEQITDDLETFLSRSAVMSGKAEQDAAKVLKRLREESDIARSLPEIWHKMLTEPDKELIDRVRSRVYAELRFSPSANQIAEFLAATIVPSQSAPSVKSAFPSLSNEKVRRETRKRRRILGATVLGVYRELRSGKGMWIFVVEQVQARHPQDFLGKAAHLRGSKREFVSGDYRNKNRPEEVGDTGVFVETDFTIDEFEDLSRRLLKLFGYSDSDLQIHEDPASSIKPIDTRVSVREIGRTGESQRITGATVLGVYKQVSTWTGLVVFTAERLLACHPHDFLEKTRDLKGPKRDLVSKDTRSMTSPRRIGSSDIFVEAGWSGHIECKGKSRQLLERFGYSDSDLQIHED